MVVYRGLQALPTAALREDHVRLRKTLAVAAGSTAVAVEQVPRDPGVGPRRPDPKARRGVAYEPRPLPVRCGARPAWEVALPLWFILVPILSALAICLTSPEARAQGFGIPDREHGIGFGNLPRFTGLRINLRDADVQHVKGINLTLWFPRRNDEARLDGLMLGLAPSGDRCRGVQLGLAGVSADTSMLGIAIGGLGCGTDGDGAGLLIGGLGCGARGDLRGVVVGTLGCGAGGSLRGIAVGGIGCGAGEDVLGIAVGGIGCGAGQDVLGIAVGAIGCGAGQDVLGIAIGGIGCGAGRDFRGIGIGGLGCGAGRDLVGITAGGFGCGCGRDLRGATLGLIGTSVERRAIGLMLGGLRAEAYSTHGVMLSVAQTRIRSGGNLVGLAAAAFNEVRGTQRGITIGVLNYARELSGLQIGVLNWAADNPSWRRLLPVVNW